MEIKGGNGAVEKKETKEELRKVKSVGVLNI
jgi:hypothetical protein